MATVCRMDGQLHKVASKGTSAETVCGIPVDSGEFRTAFEPIVGVNKCGGCFEE